MTCSWAMGARSCSRGAHHSMQQVHRQSACFDREHALPGQATVAGCDALLCSEYLFLQQRRCSRRTGRLHAQTGSMHCQSRLLLQAKRLSHVPGLVLQQLSCMLNTCRSSVLQREHAWKGKSF